MGRTGVSDAAPSSGVSDGVIPAVPRVSATKDVGFDGIDPPDLHRATEPASASVRERRRWKAAVCACCSCCVLLVGVLAGVCFGLVIRRPQGESKGPRPPFPPPPPEPPPSPSPQPPQSPFAPPLPSFPPTVPAEHPQLPPPPPTPPQPPRSPSPTPPSQPPGPPFAPCEGPGSADGTVRLLLRAAGFKNADHTAKVWVHTDEGTWYADDSAWYTGIHTIDSASRAVVGYIDGVPSGIDVGVFVVHDKDNNGRPSRTWYGYPKEGMTSSNGAQGGNPFTHPCGGNPCWSDAKIATDAATTPCVIVDMDMWYP